MVIEREVGGSDGRSGCHLARKQVTFPGLLFFRYGCFEGFERSFMRGDILVELSKPLFLSRRQDPQERLRVAIANTIFSIFRDIVEEGIELIKVLLRNRVILVIMALCAVDGQSKPCDTCGCDSIDHIEISIFAIDQSPFVAGHDIAMKPLATCCWIVAWGSRSPLVAHGVN